ncbi:class I SAM-dependent methyltransferase [Nocardia sp. NPDC058058]|uniref:class I SAM-dependent methyltransferase n=1 Tax=Nocardia sp. NPDC058058 TaxID=3346317 RepID=UPI0036DF68D3
MAAVASSSSGGLFADAAWHYARYRPGYPQVFLDEVIRRAGLDGTGRLLDLGCGTGQLTLAIAAHVATAVGLDPEPEMLAEAASQAQAQKTSNVIWEQGDSADLPGQFGRFRLVTMGRSFHWMDRAQVLTTLDDMVEDSGVVVIANDNCLVRPSTTWQRTIEDVQRSFLPPGRDQRPIPVDVLHVRHEQILANSPFSQVHRQVFEFARPWTIEQAIGYLYSTSLPLRRLLGDKRTAFEDAVTAALRDLDPTGHFIEPVSLEVLFATRADGKRHRPAG